MPSLSLSLSHTHTDNMPPRMATCCREKAVLVTVYVERPRRKRVSLNQHHHHHHQHLHHPKHGVAGSGYDRRADLLNYSQRLQESARSAASTPLHPKPTSSNNQQPITKIIAVRSKPKYARVPTCLGNWKISIPSFLTSLTSLQAKKERKKKKKKKQSGSTTNKIKAVMKSIEVQKKWGFVSKLFSTLRKHR